MRNKSDLVKNKNKKYFERFTKLNVFSDTKPSNFCVKPDEMNQLFRNAVSNERIDQSVLQYYIILGMQDLYHNYILPLEKENLEMKKMLLNVKDKNNQRFDFLTKQLQLKK